MGSNLPEHQMTASAVIRAPQDVMRISELEAALRNLLADCDSYEQNNNLSGTWATIENARKVLGS